MTQLMQSHNNRYKLTAFLAALSFFLSTIEYMIPKPIPFMRIGLANLPLLIAVDLLPFNMYMLLALVKTIGMSMLTGSLLSYLALFSFAGTISSAITMRGLKKLFGKNITYIGLCVAGAVTSNMVQVAIARVIIFGPSAKLMAPFFLALGLVSGLVLGIFTQIFTQKSQWFKTVLYGYEVADELHVSR